MSHSRAFSNFSMAYVDFKVSQSRLHKMLQNSLIAAKKLTYFNISGQPIHTLNFLPNQKSEAVAFEVLILNDCVYLDENRFRFAVFLMCPTNISVIK